MLLMTKHKPSPVSYYGGKQNMLNHILPLIPSHLVYTECFFGSGAVFFAKEKSAHEVINDKNNLIVNFYKIVKTKFPSLKEKVEATLFSRSTYSVAKVIWNMPHLFDEVTQAWAFYVGCNMGFSSMIGTWGYDKYGQRLKATQNKKILFNENFVKRLENTTIESSDANRVIRTFDSPDTFHYIDPPYFNSECGHYKGYSILDFRELLETLKTIKGKFLLSSYPSEILDSYTKENGWHTKSFTKSLSAFKGSRTPSSKTSKIEVLTANYPI